MKIDYEFILLFKKQGKPSHVTKEIKERSRINQQDWNEYFNGHWNFPGCKQDAHLAMFPEELPKRLITMFSFVGEAVLDPFLGSGTTSLAAMKLERNSIGYEINDAFLQVIHEKIGVSQTNIFPHGEVEIVKREETSFNIQNEIAQLPYVFHDPVVIDKKGDPKKFRFGSKIDSTPPE